MVKVLVRDTIFNVPSTVPYIELLLQQKSIGVDRVDNMIYLDLDPIAFREYAKYANGKEFKMDDDVNDIFRFMEMKDTIVDNMGYPYDYAAVKYHDNWIRNNFDQSNDPYWNLVEIPIVNKLNFAGLCNGSYIAGGAALYMAGKVQTYGDIDIFYTRKEALNENMEAASINGYDLFQHSLSYTKYMNPDGWRPRPCKIQHIFRLYKSPSEIVHGFDLDCVGVLYDPSTDKLWATKRALYSIENTINYFDPDRASPSYYSRLAKYSRRGYDVYIPFLGDLLSEHELMRWRNFAYKLSKNAKTKTKLFDDDPVLQMYTAKYIKMENDKNDISDYNGNIGGTQYLPKDNISDNRTVDKMGNLLKRRIRESSTLTDSICITYRDSLFDIYSANSNMSDSLYEESLNIIRVTDTDKIHLKSPILMKIYNDEHIDDFIIKWKVRNPGEQVSGTFQPTPLGNTKKDMIEWVSKSIMISS